MLSSRTAEHCIPSLSQIITVRSSQRTPLAFCNSFRNPCGPCPFPSGALSWSIILLNKSSRPPTRLPPLTHHHLHLSPHAHLLALCFETLFSILSFSVTPSSPSGPFLFSLREVPNNQPGKQTSPFHPTLRPTLLASTNLHCVTPPVALVTSHLMIGSVTHFLCATAVTLSFRIVPAALSLLNPSAPSLPSFIFFSSSTCTLLPFS